MQFAHIFMQIPPSETKLVGTRNLDCGMTDIKFYLRIKSQLQAPVKSLESREVERKIDPKRLSTWCLDMTC